MTRSLTGATRRSITVAVVSTALFVVVAVALVVSSPGWPRVQQSFLDPVAAWRALPAVAEGMLLNLGVLAAVMPAAAVLGLAVALVRTSVDPMWAFPRWLAGGYVDVLRGMPLLVTLYLIGFGLPGLQLQGVPTDPVVLGAIALTLTYGAYVAEVLRGGIQAVDPSLPEAASLDGASRWQTMRLVVLPQAVRSQYPALLNDLVALQKDCGLISVLGAIDAVRAARIESAESFTFTPYVVAGGLFVLLAIPTGRLADRIARRAG